MARRHRLAALVAFGAVLLGPALGDEPAAAAVDELSGWLQSFQGPQHTHGPRNVAELSDKEVLSLLFKLDSAVVTSGGRAGLATLSRSYARPDADKAKRAFFVALLIRGLACRPFDEELVETIVDDLAKCGGRDAILALLPYFNGDESENGPEVRRVLDTVPAPEALQILEEAFPHLKPGARIGAMQALAERHYSQAIPLFLAELKSSEPDCRTAALKALGQVGDAKVAPVLIAALQEGADAERHAAFDACLAVGDRLNKGGKPAEAAQVCASALKGAPTAADKVAALQRIGRRGSAQDVPTVAPFLGDPDPRVQEAAQQCLVGMHDPKVSEALAEAMKTASAGEKAGLLGVLSARKEPAAAEAIDAATKDPSPEVRLAALRLAGRLASPEAEQALLALTQTSSAAARADAAEAYLQIGDARWRATKDGPVAAYARALELATTDGQRTRALSALATWSRDAPSEVAPPKVRDTTKQEGLEVYLGLASRLADTGDKDRAREMLRRALDMNLPRERVATVIAKLGELGVSIDLGRPAGYVTTWWVIGPFPGHNIDQEHAPEKSVDLTAKVTAGDGELSWARHHTNDPCGVVDLNALMKPDQDVTAYLYAEVTVDRDQAVLLKTGSDDDEKVWLNGGEVYKFGGGRFLRVDDATERASLSAGVNRILVKVTNQTLGWLVCLRLTGLDGKPAQFIQKEN